VRKSNAEFREVEDEIQEICRLLSEYVGCAVLPEKDCNCYHGRMKLDDQIIPYLNTHCRNHFRVASFDAANITKVAGGAYNANFRVQVEKHDILVRTNIEPQSGLDTQIEYEYQTLEHLATYNIAPKPLFLDNSRKSLPYGLLIEEFILGGHLQFSVPAIERAAQAMAMLHSVPIVGSGFRRRVNPLREHYDSIAADVAKYQHRNPQAKLLSPAIKLLRIVKKGLTVNEKLHTPRSLIHTDPNPANLIDTGQKVYFIDWEQGRIDDPSYDVGAFFTVPLNLYESPRALSEEEKQAFLKAYIAKTSDTTIGERAQVRTMLHTLGCVIWAAHRLLDIKENKLDEQLGTENISKLETMAEPASIENLLAL
jgi:thiamine kinase-like enzyme